MNQKSVVILKNQDKIKIDKKLIFWAINVQETHEYVVSQ